MPTARLVNPRRSRARRANAKRHRRDSRGRFLRRKRRNPAAGGGELLIMGNPRRRRKHNRRAASHHGRRRRRRHNPVSYAVARPVRRRRRHHAMSYNPRRRRRHNPFGISGKDAISVALWGIAGGITARAVPQLLLKDGNTGIMGYGANALTTGIFAWAMDRFVGGNAGRGVLIGGVVMTAGRIISDLFGKTLVSFGDVFGTTGTSGLGAHGDPSFDLGLYVPNEFVVPTWSDGVYQNQSYPFMGPSSALTAPTSSVGMTPAGPVAMPTKAHTGTSGLGFMSTQRLKSRFAA